jgi:hypothetical protein
MDSMDNFRERFEALEQRTEQLKHQTHILARQARWWRGIACGVIVLALLGIPLQSGKAQYEGKDLAQRVADLEYKLEYVTGGPNEVVITGANLRIVNGLGSTDTTNGLGNLIVGYNESRPSNIAPPDNRTGSHNVVVGKEHNFSSFGGVVVGLLNEISGDFSSVSGGRFNTANGFAASVSGGTANFASGRFSSVSGGGENSASDTAASVSGGEGGRASGFSASVSGGERNTASGLFSSVSGGTNRTAPGAEDWAAGPLFADN